MGISKEGRELDLGLDPGGVVFAERVQLGLEGGEVLGYEADREGWAATPEGLAHAD